MNAFIFTSVYFMLMLKMTRTIVLAANEEVWITTGKIPVVSSSQITQWIDKKMGAQMSVSQTSQIDLTLQSSNENTFELFLQHLCGEFSSEVYS